jgi:hypothetical protein
MDRQLRMRSSRRFSIKNKIERERHFMVRDYIRKLAKCFPKQGHAVQSHLRKAGLFRDWTTWHTTPWIRDFRRKNPHFYSENLEMSLALGRALGEGKEYGWVWVGLPSFSKAKKLSLEETEMFNEESKRLADIVRRRTEEENAKAVKLRADLEAKMRAAEAEAVRIKNARDAAKANAQESVLEISTVSPLEKSGNPSLEKTDSPKADNGGDENGKPK